jgi:hypothetical protein
MAEHHGYCVKCRGRKKIKDARPTKIRNEKSKNKMIEGMYGKCYDCNGDIYAITGHS